MLRDVLVPVDFSTASLAGLDFAVSLVGREGEIYLLHVIDADFVMRLAEAGFSGVDEAVTRMRQAAEERLRAIVETRPEGGPAVDTMVVIGKPFAEILKVAADLDFQAIVISVRGRGGGDLEELLFGTTAEKILRGATIPVICVPGHGGADAEPE